LNRLSDRGRYCRLRPRSVTYTVSCAWSGACRNFRSDLMGSDSAVGGHGILKSALIFSALPISNTSQIRTSLLRWRASAARNQMENSMPRFILSLNWTEQGIRSVKDAPKRAQASRELAKKVGVEIKEVYLFPAPTISLSLSMPPAGTDLTDVLDQRDRNYCIAVI